MHTHITLAYIHSKAIANTANSQLGSSLRGKLAVEDDNVSFIVLLWFFVRMQKFSQNCSLAVQILRSLSNSCATIPTI